MLLHLSLQNLVPEIAIKKVDFLGHEDSEKLNEHPQVALVRLSHRSVSCQDSPPELAAGNAST